MQDNENQVTDAGALIAAVERLADVRGYHIEVDGETVNFAFMPEGKTVEDLRKLADPYLPRPRRAKGVAELTDLDSLIEYTNRHKTSESVVFLDDRRVHEMRLVSVFNPNEKSADDELGLAGFADFGARYQFPISDEFKAWRAVEGKDLSQADFASFLEARILDVVEPANLDPEKSKVRAIFDGLGVNLAGAARLLDLSRGLQVSVDQTVAAAVNLASGEGSLVFKEEHRDENGAPIKVPGGFAIGIPLFRLGVRYTIGVRLRYRVRSGRVVWTLQPIEVERIVEHAIAEAAARVRQETGLPVFRGAGSP